MKSDFSYDPAAALEEVDARGETAEIFADIRKTMNIPLVTSIWRGLAGMGDGLKDAWRAAKPVFETGEPERALARVVSKAAIPIPLALTASQLACLGLTGIDLAEIRTIISAYNRSNGMNLVALAALVNPSNGEPAGSALASRRDWPALRPLMRRSEIGEDVWGMVLDVNQFGAAGRDSSVATLWRHLAHWPKFLALVYSAFAPFQAARRIDSVNEEVVALAAGEGRVMASFRVPELRLSEQVMETINGYVSSPTQVARMVTMGHAMQSWLG